MFRYLHKIMLIVASFYFLPHIQAGALAHYTDTNRYPVATQIGIGGAAGVLGAGLGFKYGNPYVTGGAGVTLATLLAKRAWDTALLPKQNRYYLPMALSTLGGLGSGALIAKLLQDRGWNPYILAAAAAGTGALCGLGGHIMNVRNAKQQADHFIQRIIKKGSNPNVSFWRNDSKNLPLLTNEQKALIDNAYTNEQIAQIIQGNLPVDIQNQLQGASIDDWFQWAKNIIGANINENERNIRFQQIKDRLNEYLNNLSDDKKLTAARLKYLFPDKNIRALLTGSPNISQFIVNLERYINNEGKKYFSSENLLVARLDANLKLIEQDNAQKNLGQNKVALLDQVIDDVKHYLRQKEYVVDVELNNLVMKYSTMNNQDKIKQIRNISSLVRKFFKEKRLFLGLTNASLKNDFTDQHNEMLQLGEKIFKDPSSSNNSDEDVKQKGRELLDTVEQFYLQNEQLYTYNDKEEIKQLIAEQRARLNQKGTVFSNQEDISMFVGTMTYFFQSKLRANEDL